MTAKPSFFKHLQIAAALFLIDMFLGGFPAMTLMGLFIFLLFWTASLACQLMFRWWKKQPFQPVAPKLVAAAMYLFFTALGGGIYCRKLRVSDARGVAIASACEAYKVRHGTYPKALNLLVPDFMIEIPAPAFRALHPYFIYDFSEKRPTPFLKYVPIPFSSRVYDFQTGQWITRD